MSIQRPRLASEEGGRAVAPDAAAAEAVRFEEEDEEDEEEAAVVSDDMRISLRAMEWYRSDRTWVHEQRQEKRDNHCKYLDRYCLSVLSSRNTSAW